MRRKLMLLLATLGLLAAIPAVALANHSDEAASSTGKFQLGGTAELIREPGVRPTNHVVRIDTTEAGTAGSAQRELHVQVDDLDDQLSLRYFIVSGDCGGGSPRIALAIDTNGDGTLDGHIHGHVDPNSTGCPDAHGEWDFADLTDGEARWETGQLGLGLAFVVPWAVARDAIQSAFPDHDVMHGLMVDDSAWLATAAGVAYYDDIQIGDLTLSGPGDTIGRRLD